MAHDEVGVQGTCHGYCCCPTSAVRPPPCSLPCAHDNAWLPFPAPQPPHQQARPLLKPGAAAPRPAALGTTAAPAPQRLPQLPGLAGLLGAPGPGDAGTSRDGGRGRNRAGEADLAGGAWRNPLYRHGVLGGCALCAIMTGECHTIA